MWSGTASACGVHVSDSTLLRVHNVESSSTMEDIMLCDLFSRFHERLERSRQPVSNSVAAVVQSPRRFRGGALSV